MKYQQLQHKTNEFVENMAIYLADSKSKIGLKLDLHTNWSQIWLEELEITKRNMGSLTGIFNLARDKRPQSWTHNIQEYI